MNTADQEHSPVHSDDKKRTTFGTSIWEKLKLLQFKYEVNTTMNVMEPWEKVIINTVLLVFFVWIINKLVIPVVWTCGWLIVKVTQVAFNYIAQLASRSGKE